MYQLLGKVDAREAADLVLRLITCQSHKQHRTAAIGGCVQLSGSEVTHQEYAGCVCRKHDALQAGNVLADLGAVE